MVDEPQPRSLPTAAVLDLGGKFGGLSGIELAFQVGEQRLPAHGPSPRAHLRGCSEQWSTGQQLGIDRAGQPVYQTHVITYKRVMCDLTNPSGCVKVEA
jgi:hypothetical protein